MGITLIVFAICITLKTMAQESEEFKLSELYERAATIDGSYLRFLDNDKLSSGIYQLKAGEEDKQEPHEWDEIYYVLEGKAKLNAGDEQYDASTGMILFVAANVVHQFVEIEKDLKILVFFSKQD
jgi:quercetin dioxygenase-like cupin family protein